MMNDFTEFSPQIQSPYLVEEIFCHESLLWTLCYDSTIKNSTIKIVTYNKFDHKKLFSFDLEPENHFSVSQRARIYEIAVRHDLLVFACGSFSFIVKLDEKVERTSSTCVIS